MSDIRFNNWLHQSGTGGVYQDSSGNVGIGTSVPSTTLEVEGTISANAAVISGNLTVEGVLTYDDVTSIDSVGVITARDGIDITSGDIVLNKSRSDTHASLIIDKPDAGSGTLKFHNNGSDSGYIQHTNAEHLHYYLPSGSGYHAFYTNGSNERLRITDTGEVRVPDGGKFTAGTGDDLEIYHSADNASYIRDVGTGNLNIDSTAGNVQIRVNGSESAIIAKQNNAVELYYDNAKKLETTTTGAKVTGALEVTQEYPSIRPTLDLNFATTKVLDDRITFTRDSLGTYTDELGVLKYASNNTPRFDHNPDTGESLGLLIEESKTNLVTHSENFSNSAWAENGASESLASSVTAPDETTGSVYELIESSATSGHFMYDSISVSSNTNYTWSVWMKANTRTYGYMTEGNTQGATAYFNLSTGTVNKTSGTGSPSATAQKYPNGWVRCTMTFTTGASQTSANVQFGPNLDGITFSYAGDGSSGIYVWGGQGEAGSFPTSYIPTSGSTVTRAQDFAKITGTNFTDFYNQAEGTLVCDQSISDLTTANQYSVILSSDINESIGMGYRVGGAASGGYGFYIIKSGDALFRNVAGVVSADTPIRTALAYKLNDGATVVDGGTVVTDTSLVLPTPDRMLIGEGYSANNELKRGHIRKLTYYNKRLPNAQLQGLTQQ